MKKMIRTALLLALAAVMAPIAQAQQSQGKTLNVPLRRQEHSNWCWAATSKMLLDYKGGVNATQCQIVNYAMGVNYACGNSTFNWYNQANQPAQASVIGKILYAGGLNASVGGSLNFNAVKSTINANNPFIIGWYFQQGGHVVVCKGYSGNNLVIQDPWPGEGSYYISYQNAVNGPDRRWGNTISLR